mgnify:CR=1 FL=1
MKSKGFKKLSYEEALLKVKTKPRRAKTPPKKKAKKAKLPSISKLKKQLWEVIKVYIRERDQSICWTSGVKVEGSNRHVGHGIPSSVGGGLLRWHPLNLHVQSYVENIHHSGNGGVYYRNCVAKYGQEKMDKVYELKNHTVQIDRYFLNTLIDLYKQGNQEEIIKFLEGFV